MMNPLYYDSTYFLKFVRISTYIGIAVILVVFIIYITLVIKERL